MKTKILTWNLEWAEPSSSRGKRISAIINQVDADILILTEASLHCVPENGFVVSAGNDWGYIPKHPDNRKVFMWSKQPWTDTDNLGSEDLPGGRFVSGITNTPCGPLKIIGCCIPWQDAHVRTGRSDRQRWEDHINYLHAVKPLLVSDGIPFVFAGDFNQRIPRKRTPIPVGELLTETLNGLKVVTETNGEIQLIDHIAHSKNLESEMFGTIPKADDLGALTDHIGAIAEVWLSK